MESCFPAMLVLWLGREFYRGMYGNAGRVEPSTLATKCGISKLLEFSLYLCDVTVGPCDITAYREDYKRTLFGSQSNRVCRSTRIAFGMRASLESIFGVSSAVRASKLLDAERY
ncbi:hypothetical protein AVEN_142857-1 [Araneus ventricosus]|uniref:Uncharacterized protein n=1 Tax=Araneus ventricosus TaxID=182803 RepID=A0A4Y2VQA4_ARAVE|nr:hypothetical protein AVEN_142857-1 [Araneus ventricosus]